MNLSTLMIINAIVATVFGVGFLLVPNTMGSLYDVEVNETLIYIVRLLGAAFVEIGALAWFARNADDSVARRAIIIALLIGNTIGFVVALIGQLNNIFGPLGWSSVAIYLLFTLGFGYFQFIKTES